MAEPLKPTNEADVLEIIHGEIETGARLVGINARAARDLAAAVVERIRLHIGGDRFYVRKRSRCDHALALFNGTNHDAVCREVGISRRTLDRYLATPPDCHKQEEDDE